MLDDHFIEWWFAPWRIAAGAPAAMHADDALGQRDSYQDWCAAAGLPPELAGPFDPLWAFAARQTDRLADNAGLFMGLIAARQGDRSVLTGLPFADQKWCLSIAATQPMQAFAVGHPDCQDSAQIRGLAELAIRLEHGFPGLWPRLQLNLPSALLAAVTLRQQNSWADGATVAQSAVRSQRCWRLCCQRSEARA